MTSREAPSPTIDEPLIANNLEAERIAAGFTTVAELAERAGIDPAWCSAIEAGEILASREEYERLLAALGDIPANRIYDRTWRQLTLIDQAPAYGMAGVSRMWRQWRDEGHLMMSRDSSTTSTGSQARTTRPRSM